MRVLVTGASGFIGRYVCEQLRERSIPAVTIGRQAPSSLVERHIKCDLLSATDFSPYIKAADASHFIHLAWVTEHGDYWQSPANAQWLHATTQLAKAFIQNGGEHIVAAGTCAEYDWRYGYCTETLTPLRASSHYSDNKIKAQQHLQALCATHGTSLAWTRLFFCYGAGENHARLVPSLARVFRGDQVPFGVNLDIYRDFIHVSDVANALIHLAEKKAEGVFNVASGEPLKLRSLVEQLAAQLHTSADVVTRLPPSVTDNTPLLVGNNLALRQTGWHATRALAEGLLDFSQVSFKAVHQRG